jgi:hypothetical protein
MIQQEQKDKNSHQWYRRLVVIALAYTPFVMLVSILPSLWLINQPFGGFFWSWDSGDGRYRVAGAYINANSPLQTADFILAVDEQAGPMPLLLAQAKDIYERAAAVCELPPLTQRSLLSMRSRAGARQWL